MLPEELSKEDLHKMIVSGAIGNKTNRYFPETFHHIGIRNDIFKRSIEDAKMEVKTIEIELIDPVGIL